MKKFLPFTLLISLLFSTASFAQEETVDPEEAIQAIIQEVFDGMRQGDSSMISQHLMPGVIMHSVSVAPTGFTKVHTESNPQAWLEAVAKPKEQVYDERVSNLQINVTDGIATAWMDYSFYLGENFSHCGVNSFQFVKMMGKWKIIYIIDTRKRSDCRD